MRLGAPTAVAAAGAAIFALHPLQSAAVAYVSGRTDILAFLFVLLSLHGICSFVSGLRDDATMRWRTVGWAGAVLATTAAFAAPLAKESGVVAAPLLLAVAWFLVRTGGSHGDRFPRALTGVVGAAAVLCLGAFIYVLPPAFLDGLGVSISDRFAGAGTVLQTFARLVVWPADLHLDRLEPLAGPNAVAIGVVALVVMAVVVAGVFLRPTRLGLAAAATVICYAPAAGYVPIYPQIADTWIFAGEQLLYAALGPFALLILGLVTGAFYRHGVSRYGDRLAYGSAVVVAVLSVAPVLARQADFADPESVYKATLAYSPSPRACFNLGVFQIGQARYEEALTTYEACLELSPNDARSYDQIGVAHQKLGHRNRAEISYARALELDPEDPFTWSNYASLDATWGYFDDAREKWRHALELSPDFSPAREGLKKLAIVERQRSPRGASGSD